MRNSAPPLYGLVLSGGRSTRLGRDKGQLEFHGKTQIEYLHELLEKFCEKVFVSCRRDQAESEGRKGLPQLHDAYDNLGPTGGILTAFDLHPGSAWLAVACDLPYVDHDLLSDLVRRRDAQKMATAFKAHSSDFPEPVCAIYEPAMRQALLNFVRDGHNCPRKALINSDIALLPLTGGGDLLFNLNTPEDYSRIAGAGPRVRPLAAP